MSLNDPDHWEALYAKHDDGWELLVLATRTV
ncbi:MAG: hypothetical protein JWO36_3918 [Myxococcales bacterium]|nr:hypothetical protein [Myxococcales bacterium]